MYINEEAYKENKKKVEEELYNYSYYAISIQMPNLGQATRWNQPFVKSASVSDPTVYGAMEYDYREKVINAIEYVMDKLDPKSKVIIEECYFRDNVISAKEVMEDLKISRYRYFELKKMAIYKFMLSLRYI